MSTKRSEWERARYRILFYSSSISLTTILVMSYYECDNGEHLAMVPNIRSIPRDSSTSNGSEVEVTSSIDSDEHELLSSPIYSALGCFMNNSRTGSDRDLIVFLLERGHRGTSICIKFGRSTNWPIRWFFARDFDNDFSGSYSVSLRLVDTPFNSEPFYLWNKLLMTIPSRFFQELQGFRKDQETS